MGRSVLLPTNAGMPEIGRRGPEGLVGRTFRCSMRAKLLDERAALTLAWQEFANAAGETHANRLTHGMAAFAHALSEAATRRIEVFPAGCPGFCRDECLAISIIAAAQHAACPAMKACIFALIASSRTEPAMAAAGTLAMALKDAGQDLNGTALCNASALVSPQTGQRPC